MAGQPVLPSERAMRAARRIARDGPRDADVPASLAAVAVGVELCRRCDLWRDATQGVPGEGAARARLMFVGEQPGDQEDLAGRPFVGPAGRLFRAALEAAGVDLDDVWITNAVKHFKHDPRGRRRIHKTPTAGEVRACRWWLEHERRLVRPRAVVALGATAALALFGRQTPVGANRGRRLTLPDGATALVTVHPAFLLRIPDAAARGEARRAFLRDLELARDLSA